MLINMHILTLNISTMGFVQLMYVHTVFVCLINIMKQDHKMLFLFNSCNINDMGVSFLIASDLHLKK